MNKLLRVTLFILVLITLSLIFFFWTDSIFPNNNINLIIYTSILLLSFFSLFVEHFFSKPTDIMATTISILLLLIPLKNEFTLNIGWYYSFIAYTSCMGMCAFVSILLFSGHEQISSKYKVSKTLYSISTTLGKTKYQYFILFILSILCFVNSDSNYFLILLCFSLIIVSDPWKLIEQLYENAKPKKVIGIGEIFGVQSKNTFLIKLYENTPSVSLFDLVVFRYSLEKAIVKKGIVVDVYLLNQEQWLRVLADKSFDSCNLSEKEKNQLEDNIVYLYNEPESEQELTDLIGIITEDTKIDKIRFIYNGRKDIQDGALINVLIQSRRVYYQVIQGITDIEQLEKKNETGEIIGEAIQLGEWDKEKVCFVKYGWVPAINSPVYLSSENIEVTTTKNEIEIGKIPNTNIPLIFNKTLALSHHLAILGVTGTGKSVFARFLIKEIIKDEDVKIICVDFTEEYDPKLNCLKPVKLISKENEEDIVKKVNKIELIINGNYGRENESTKALHQEINKSILESISQFLNSSDKIAIFELPDVSNSTGILDYTRCFFRMLFYTAKKNKNFGKRVSIILEEAHTVIPEYNFIGIDDKRSSALVNSVGQIALQGRKYNIGFIVIAQRTANVSKTVLTQCNTIITFQQFDKTSNDFLSNYFGKDITTILPSLKFRQAIAFGKAFRSSVPMVFEVPEIREDTDVDTTSITGSLELEASGATR